MSGQNGVLNYTMINFDLSWDHSWRTSTYESNWDAAWVFVKWRLKTSNVWNHATIDTLGHTVPADATIETPLDERGVFIYNAYDTISSNVFTGIQLRWDYGVDGLFDNDSVEICVFAIEMVYVPQGEFYLGDGELTDPEGHFTNENTTDPFFLTSEGAITLGDGSAGSMGDNGGNGMDFDDDFAGGTVKTLPAAFPKGYNAFYIMKYEVSQEQYVEFLNKLTYTQQETRTANAPTSTSGTGAMCANTFRNGIDVMTPGTSAGTPAVYASNYTSNAIFNQTFDGQNIACNFISWGDLAAYLDWSGLRPFTELEYEKACRGSNITPFMGEYAWGDTTLKGAKSIIYPGYNNETDTITGANAAYRDTSGVQGPLRVGNFAKSTTDRIYSGGAYYGAMDMSGNLWERIITVSNANGRSFTGVHGDGNLDTSGYANVSNWPSNTTALGIGSRGGGWESNAVSLRISSRYYSNTTVAIRGRYYGGRGVRNAHY